MQKPHVADNALTRDILSDPVCWQLQRFLNWEQVREVLPRRRRRSYLDSVQPAVDAYLIRPPDYRPIDRRERFIRKLYQDQFKLPDSMFDDLDRRPSPNRDALHPWDDQPPPAPVAVTQTTAMPSLSLPVPTPARPMLEFSDPRRPRSADIGTNYSNVPRISSLLPSLTQSGDGVEENKSMDEECEGEEDELLDDEDVEEEDQPVPKPVPMLKIPEKVLDKSKSTARERVLMEFDEKRKPKPSIKTYMPMSQRQVKPTKQRKGWENVNSSVAQIFHANKSFQPGAARRQSTVTSLEGGSISSRTSKFQATTPATGSRLVSKENKLKPSGSNLAPATPTNRRSLPDIGKKIVATRRKSVDMACQVGVAETGVNTETERQSVGTSTRDDVIYVYETVGHHRHHHHRHKHDREPSLPISSPPKSKSLVKPTFSSDSFIEGEKLASTITNDNSFEPLSRSLSDGSSMTPSASQEDQQKMRRTQSLPSTTTTQIPLPRFGNATGLMELFDTVSKVKPRQHQALKKKLSDVMEESDETLTVDELAECRFCKRRFTVQRLAIHETACQKASTAKSREVFDSRQKRLSLFTAPNDKEILDKGKSGSPAVKVPSQWRLQHAVFVKKIRFVRNRAVAKFRKRSEDGGFAQTL